MLNLFRRNKSVPSGHVQMYDQDSFYRAFEEDLRFAQNEVVIECPFITTKRINALLPILSSLHSRGVSIIVNTRDPIEHNEDYEVQALNAIASLQYIGVEVLYTARHHRKLAIIDKAIVWNGSLNILSQIDSCEIMWRTNSAELADKLLGFINVKRYTRR